VCYLHTCTNQQLSFVRRFSAGADCGSTTGSRRALWCRLLSKPRSTCSPRCFKKCFKYYIMNASCIILSVFNLSVDESFLTSLSAVGEVPGDRSLILVSFLFHSLSCNLWAPSLKSCNIMHQLLKIRRHLHRDFCWNTAINPVIRMHTSSGLTMTTGDAGCRIQPVNDTCIKGNATQWHNAALFVHVSGV